MYSVAWNNTNTQVLHRLASQNEKSDSILEAIAVLESSLSTLIESVSTVNNNTTSKVKNAVSTLSRGLEVSSLNKSDEVAGIKNHLTSLFNISMETTRNRIEDYVRDLTGDLSRELTKICDEVTNLSSLTMDMAAQCTERCSTSNVLTGEQCLADAVGGDILNEINALPL